MSRFQKFKDSLVDAGLLVMGSVVSAFAAARRTAFIGFLLRYWVMILLLVIFVSLIFSNALFHVVGMLLYLPALVFGSILSALLVRNLLYPETTDKDADSGRFAKEWNALDMRTRTILHVVQILVFFAVSGVIAAALATR